MHHLAQDIGQTVLSIGTVAFAIFVAYKLNEKFKAGSGWTRKWSGLLAVLAFFITFVVTNEIERRIDKLYPHSSESDDDE